MRCLCSAHKDSREIRSSVDGFTPPTQLSSDASYWEKRLPARLARRREGRASIALFPTPYSFGRARGHVRQQPAAPPHGCVARRHAPRCRAAAHRSGSTIAAGLRLWRLACLHRRSSPCAVGIGSLRALPLLFLRNQGALALSLNRPSNSCSWESGRAPAELCRCHARTCHIGARARAFSIPGAASPPRPTRPTIYRLPPGS